MGERPSWEEMKFWGKVGERYTRNENENHSGGWNVKIFKVELF